MSEEAATPVLELRGITKVFPGTVANDHIDLDLRRGEVHALLGENGAGKSTLMNILYGLSKPDEGEIILNGNRITFSSPKDAIERGIGMVHQHFMLIPVMTVAENIVLGIEPSDKGFLDYDAARARVRELARTFGFHIDPDAKIEDIGVGQQQRVEILKALYRNAGILILDEPTAVLTPQEATEFFGILRDAEARGYLDHLHQPQAERGAGDRRPRHGAAPREEDRDRADRGSDAGVARPRHGRARGPASRREGALATG